MKQHNLLIPILVLTMSSSCALPGDSAWSGAHFNAFGGMIDVSSGGTVSDINITTPGEELVGDLDMTSVKDNVFYGGARIGFAPLEFVYSQFAVDADHDSVMTAGGTFFGTLLTANLDATTNLDLSLRKLMMGMDIFNSGTFRIGLMIGVDELNFANFEVTTVDGIPDGLGLGGFLVDPGTSQIIVADEKVLVPMGGLRADVALPLSGLRFGAEYSGISIDVDDAQIEYWDLDVNLNYALMENVELLVGYRDISLDVAGDFGDAEMIAALGFNGPYFALGILF